MKRRQVIPCGVSGCGRIRKPPWSKGWPFNGPCPVANEYLDNPIRSTDVLLVADVTAASNRKHALTNIWSLVHTTRVFSGERRSSTRPPHMHMFFSRRMTWRRTCGEYYPRSPHHKQPSRKCARTPARPGRAHPWPPGLPLCTPGTPCPHPPTP